MPSCWRRLRARLSVSAVVLIAGITSSNWRRHASATSACAIVVRLSEAVNFALNPAIWWLHPTITPDGE